MLRKNVLGLLAALSLQAVGISVVSRCGAASTTNIPLRASFEATTSDGTPCLITGDSNGPYVDGQDNVECNINPSTGDFRLGLHSANHPPRYLAFSFTSPVRPSDPQSLCEVWPSAIPVPSYAQSSIFLNVNNLLNVNSPGPTGAGFQVPNLGNLYFDGKYTPGYCSTQVFVQPLGTNSWRITAMPTNAAPAGDVAVLVQNINRQPEPVGYYHMQFSLVVQPK